MKINKRSWHYRVYCEFTAHPERHAERYETLCSYFWKVIGGVILIAIFGPILILGVGTILILGWFFGFWPNIGKYEEGHGLFHSDYKFDGRRRHVFAPWEIATVAGLIYWAFASWETFSIFLMIIAAIAVFAGLMFLVFKGWKTETFRLVRAYISAKKRGICPLITFEGDLPK